VGAFSLSLVYMRLNFLFEQVNARSSRPARRKRLDLQSESNISRTTWSDPRPHAGKTHHRSVSLLLKIFFANETFTGTSARYLLRHMLTHPSSLTPLEVAIDQQFINPPSSPEATSVGDSAEVQRLCEEAITALPQQVKALRSGENKGVLNKIVGYVMKRSRGRADAVAVKKILEDMILGKGNIP
jgi:Asp-tRNA(Asn)/Glu-tRNA(Gln) amidotransferase B subunit